MSQEEKIEEHRSAVMAVVIAANMLRQHDLPKLLEAIERADAFGCFFDPTLWMRKCDAMNEDREMLKAAMPLWRLAEKLQASQPEVVDVEP